MKKLLSILLAVLLALTCIPFAFAEDAEPAQTPDCIKWEVSFDKEEYGLFDTALATVTIIHLKKCLLMSKLRFMPPALNVAKTSQSSELSV